MSHLQKLESNDVTPELFIECLEAQIIECEEHDLPHLATDEYFKPGDMQQYIAALEWWPKDAPARFRAPSLQELCYGIAHLPGTEPMTFMQHLTNRAQNVSMWLQEEGRNPQDPEETGKERGAAKARRGRKPKDPSVKQAEDFVKECYRDYLQACHERKQADAVWQEKVNRLRNLHKQAKEQLEAMSKR